MVEWPEDLKFHRAVVTDPCTSRHPNLTLSVRYAADGIVEHFTAEEIRTRSPGIWKVSPRAPLEADFPI